MTFKRTRTARDDVPGTVFAAVRQYMTEEPMADRPEHTEYEPFVPLALPAWAREARLTKEQLAAAERTRDYHVRKLQSRAGSERSGDLGTRSEH